MVKNNGKMAKMVKNSRHYGKNGEEVFVIFAIMAKWQNGKMAKMARMAKINGENDEFFLTIFAISPWRKSRKK